MGPFLLGTIEATYGDSGASVWSSEGLIGLNVGKTKFPDHSHQYAIDEAANFKPKNVMVTIDKINEALTRLELEAKETSPKKSAMCFDVVKGSGVYKELDDDYDDYDYDEEGEEPQSCIFLISIFGNIFFK
uniref:PDZ domain-containing protein n=1 Tax=Meloidogyne hapla TaxID=6305 RepID=A0A1I8BWT8_MELHA